MNVAVNNPKAMDKVLPGNDRASERLRDGEDPDDELVERAAYEAGEVDEWEQQMKAQANQS